MAPPSPPRRSSRARSTLPQSQQSSTSSVASGRAERSARLAQRSASSKSTPAASLSSESLEEPEESHLLRRRKRAQLEGLDRSAAADAIGIYDMANGSDDPQEEDDAVRCICGSEEYPGLPIFDEDARRGKDAADADFYAAIELTEDVTGFFLQCDVCKVWQHGACVGIISAEGSPDEYFCEKCRKDLHKIHTASNGQFYSHYLPLHRPSRATSRATSIVKDGARSPKLGGKGTRPSANSHASKRRSTMNSRDAAYDEDEQLRRAIEASKEEVHDTVEGATRRPKRGRSDSDENISNVKRQRTASESVSPSNEHAIDTKEDSDEASNDRNGASKKLRPSRSQPERTEREERERQRAEAAGKRKNRAERRRAEDSPLSEELPLASRVPATKSVEPPAPADVPPPAQSVPDTPPSNQTGTNVPHKKGNRSNHKKSAKGRNQYTRDRDLEADESPARSMSRDIQKNADDSGSGSHSKGPTSDARHGSRGKHHASKMSMIDMKRRVGAYLEFISRTQVELASESSIAPKGGESNGGSKGPDEGQEKIPSIQVNGNTGGGPKPELANGSSATSPSEAADFKDLSSMEMMDVLTRNMLKWQGQYAE